MIENGAASKAPIGPHIQVQNASASKNQERIERETTADDRRRHEVSFHRRERHESEWRNRRLTERGKGDEAHAKQRDHHNGRAHIGHIVEHRGQHAEGHRAGKSEKPSAARHDHSQRRIDHRDNGQISREIMFNVVGDFQKAQFGIAGWEHRDKICAQRALTNKKKQHCGKKQQQFARQLE